METAAQKVELELLKQTWHLVNLTTFDVTESWDY